MSPEHSPNPRPVVWGALVFAALVFTISWWHWWTFQYNSFDLAFYVQSLWLALRGQWMVSLLNVPLMGNHAEPIVFLLAPLFALCPHPMLFVAVQTLAFATMPFTAWRIGRCLNLEPEAALLLAMATLLTPSTLSVAIYEFHPEAFAAPLILLLIEARLAERRGLFWLWFLAVLSVKENMAPLLVAFCGVFAVLEWQRDRGWQFRWNVVPMAVAAGWLLLYGKVISPALNAGNVDYLQLYDHLGASAGDIVLRFFTEPSRALGALWKALTKGDMLWALLLPFLALPLLRIRWLLIATPLFLQHFLSWRTSEWSLGAHYPAPLIPLFWIAAAEGLSKLSAQKGIAAAVLIACACAHLRFGAAPEIAAELPTLGATFEEREWKADMIANIPDTAAVTAGLGFLPHLAKRERLVSLHHILKGLKTLSIATYTPPPPGDVVVVDYNDRETFNTEAGYYHPWSRRDTGEVIPSSDRLLHDYLRQAQWSVSSRNSLSVFQRGKPAASFPINGTPLKMDDQTLLAQVTHMRPGALHMKFAWDIAAERKRFPWMMLVLSDGKHLFPFVKGTCAPEATKGRYFEEWSIIFPSSLTPGYYSIFAHFYDGNAGAWNKKLPPDDPTFMLTLIDLGGMVIKPGDFGPPPGK